MYVRGGSAFSVCEHKGPYQVALLAAKFNASKSFQGVLHTLSFRAPEASRGKEDE
jgi:hypothetical protein